MGKKFVTSAAPATTSVAVMNEPRRCVWRFEVVCNVQLSARKLEWPLGKQWLCGKEIWKQYLFFMKVYNIYLFLTINPKIPILIQKT